MNYSLLLELYKYVCFLNNIIIMNYFLLKILENLQICYKNNMDKKFLKFTDKFLVFKTN